MLSTALVPPPPTPMTVMRGLKSVCGVCGIVRFRVIATSPPVVSIRKSGCYARCFDSRRASDAFFQKIDDAADESGGPFNIEVHVVHCPAFAGGPREQTRRGGERRPRCGIGQTAQRDGTPQTHLLVQHAPRHLARTPELTGA